MDILKILKVAIASFQKSCLLPYMLHVDPFRETSMYILKRCRVASSACGKNTQQWVCLYSKNLHLSFKLSLQCLERSLALKKVENQHFVKRRYKRFPSVLHSVGASHGLNHTIGVLGKLCLLCKFDWIFFGDFLVECLIHLQLTIYTFNYITLTIYYISEQNSFSKHLFICFIWP